MKIGPPSAREALNVGQLGRQRTPRRERRRLEIIRIASRVFRQKGFHRATLDDIVAELGTSKPLVYYYFKNKQELLYEVCEVATQAFQTALADCRATAKQPDGQMRDLIAKHLEVVMKHGDACVVIFNEKAHLPADSFRLITASYRKYFQEIVKLYERGAQSGRFRKLDPDVAVLGVLGACNWLTQWYQPGGRLKGPEVVAQLTSLLETGFMESGFGSRREGTRLTPNKRSSRR